MTSKLYQKKKKSEISIKGLFVDEEVNDMGKI